ncbi:helix-turn-helix transcriptional regulator [Microbacterium oxydans]|uniref:helix-turn-helix transcriptional regulator n=1 Tax=Microbacterium oxydans TaxID=82380 RepID=UPI0032670C87
MNRPAARPHCLEDSPSVSSSYRVLQANGIGSARNHQRAGALDPVLVMSVAILSLVIDDPRRVRSCLGVLFPVGPDASALRTPCARCTHYGLRVSPYKEAILATLETVPGRGDEADAEWQDFVLKLSVQLRRLRLDAGLSQEEVAHRAGLSRFIYRQYETGESRRGTAANPALRSILAIAQVLHVPIEELLPDPVPDLRSR